MMAATMIFEIAVRLPPAAGRCAASRRQRGDDRDDLCRHVLVVAQSRARRQGLRGEAAEDCALEFVERMLLRNDWAAIGPAQALAGAPSRCEVSEAWLRRCADNFARNVLRRGRRISRRELPWPERKSDDGESRAWEGPATGETPETRLLREEVGRQVWEAVRRLTPAQQDLFERHFLRGVSVGEMAEALGRSPHAVSQALLTLRIRLRGILVRQGLDEEEAWKHLGASEVGREAFFIYK